MQSSPSSVFFRGEWEKRLLVFSLSLQTQPCCLRAAPGLGNPLPLVYSADVRSPSRGPSTVPPQSSFLEESLKTTRSLHGQSRKSFSEDRSLLLHKKHCPGQRRAALGASDKVPFRFSMGRVEKNPPTSK